MATLHTSPRMEIPLLGWAKPDLWGLGGESWCIVGSLHYAKMIPQGFAQPNLQTICGLETLQVYILFMHTCPAPQKYVAIVFKSIRMTELFSCGAEYS